LWLPGDVVLGSLELGVDGGLSFGRDARQLGEQRRLAASRRLADGATALSDLLLASLRRSRVLLTTHDTVTAQPHPRPSIKSSSL